MTESASPVARRDFHGEIRRNQWHTLVILLAFGGLITVVGVIVDLLVGLGILGVIVVLLIAALVTVAAYASATAVALAGAHARPADQSEFRRYHNLVEGLCIAAGLPKPDLYVVDDVAPNAFAAGRSPRHAVLVATTGLLDELNRVELEGVLAHELSHVKNDDILAATVAVTAVGGLVILGPVAGELMQFAVGSRREVLADASGVLITRYPPGLCAALKKIQANPAVVRHHRRAMSQLWFESPQARDDHGRGSWLDRAFDTHPPLAERIRFLESM
jgi:heat shock protein HtpX